MINRRLTMQIVNNARQDKSTTCNYYPTNFTMTPDVRVKHISKTHIQMFLFLYLYDCNTHLKPSKV